MEFDLDFGDQRRQFLRALARGTDDGLGHRGGDFHRRQHQTPLPAAHQLQIDFRGKLGVQQRAVLGAGREVHAETLAKFVQGIARAGDLALGDLDRVDRTRQRNGLRGRRGKARH